MENRQILHYKVRKKLGAGGMGEVFLAEDTKLGRQVALKFLPKNMTSDPKARARFEQEARAAAALQHPNIVTIFDIAEHNDQMLIVMEYVDGISLKDLIAGRGRVVPPIRPGADRHAGPNQEEMQKKDEHPGFLLPIDKIIAIVIQVARGLAKAHEKGIFHRDIKPDNIIITNDEVAKIVDFGLAKLQGQTNLTQTGSLLGTVSYMSPEQALGQEVDYRTDIWSLGVTLYEMLASGLPFRGDYPAAILYAIINQQPLPLPQTRNGQKEIETILWKLLEKKAGDRYQHALDIIADLQTAGRPAYEKTARIFTADEKPKPAIAVLAFVNMSGDPGNEYFGDGLAEELINALTQVKGLRVAARTSAFFFKGKQADIRQIGRELGVDHVLEGSVRKAGKKLRITTQLINVADGFHLWSERFDRTTDDIFAIQDEIALTIVEKLKLELLESEKNKVVKRHTTNKKAFDLYLKGRYYWNRRYQGDMIKAVLYFQKAIRQDPNYALSYVGIADVFNILGLWSYIPPHAAYATSKAMLTKALAIDDSLSEIYTSLGFSTAGHEWDFAAADRYYSLAIELNPNNNYAHLWYATLLMVRRQYAKALAEIRIAREAEPLVALIQSMHGVLLCYSGQVETGREKNHQAIALDPGQPMPYLWMGLLYLQTPALPEKAVEYLKKADQFGIVFALGPLGMALALAGHKEEALKILSRLDNLTRESYLPFFKRILVNLHPGLKIFRILKNKYSAPLLRALVCLGLNRLEEALESLEKSYQNRDWFLPQFLVIMNLPGFPCYVDLQSQPRFKALLEKIKLTEN